MPTYEYACSSCGTHVEVYQRFSDEPLTKCGVCGGPLRKVFHPAGILFKGSGFYKTDSRTSKIAASSGDGAKKADTKVDAGKSGASTGGDSKSGDSKSGDSKSGANASSDASGAGSESGGKEQSA